MLHFILILTHLSLTVFFILCTHEYLGWLNALYFVVKYIIIPIQSSCTLLFTAKIIVASRFQIIFTVHKNIFSINRVSDKLHFPLPKLKNVCEKHIFILLLWKNNQGYQEVTLTLERIKISVKNIFHYHGIIIKKLQFSFTTLKIICDKLLF